MGWTPRRHPARVQMADLELLYFEQPDHRDVSPGREKQSAAEVCGGGGGGGGGGAAGSAPWTETREETETSFTCRLQDDDEDEDVQLIETSPRTCRPTRTSPTGLHEEEEEEEEEEDIPELYLLSDDDLSSEASGKSVDYGFIIAVTCLVTGISLVAISYTVPRDVRVDPDTVSAREMERLEREKARVGAHLDRCVIAGLCLLTLGGVLLSTLLMVSMWKGEMMRRKALAFSKHAANLYGSMSLRTGSSSHLEEDVEALS